METGAWNLNLHDLLRYCLSQGTHITRVYITQEIQSMDNFIYNEDCNYVRGEHISKFTIMDLLRMTVDMQPLSKSPIDIFRIALSTTHNKEVQNTILVSSMYPEIYLVDGTAIPGMVLYLRIFADKYKKLIGEKPSEEGSKNDVIK